jgi:hypothetical protein
MNALCPTYAVEPDSSEPSSNLLGIISAEEEVEHQGTSGVFFRQWHTLLDLLLAAAIYEIPSGALSPSIKTNVFLSFLASTPRVFGLASFMRFRGNLSCRAYLKGKSKSYDFGSAVIAEGPSAETWTVPSWRSEWTAPLESDGLDELSREIHAARKLLTLGDDWDGEGSPGYSEATLDRAACFLRHHMRWAWEKYGVWLLAPRILPGPSGSIDIHWETRHYELLVNIPTDPSAPATFYGDDYGKSSIKGMFNPSAFNFGLVTWLLRL